MLDATPSPCKAPSMDNQTPSTSHRMVLLIFLAVAVYACYSMVRPFLEPIVMAVLIGLLAYPVVLSQISATMMGVVDSAMVGRLGATELGAVGFAGIWCWTLFSFFYGTATVAQTNGDDAKLELYHPLKVDATPPAHWTGFLAVYYLLEEVRNSRATARRALGG